jgi:protein phosphatase 1L
MLEALDFGCRLRSIKHGYQLVKGKSNSFKLRFYICAHHIVICIHNCTDFLFYLHPQPEFLSDPKNAMKKAYLLTDEKILERAAELGRGGSTAVTAILISCDDSVKLVVANVGDSRAVISTNGKAKQLSVDHEPNMEKDIIEEKGGFVSNLPGNDYLLSMPTPMPLGLYAWKNIFIPF